MHSNVAVCFLTFLLAVMPNPIEEAWERSVEHGYIAMLYLDKDWTMQEIGSLMGCSKQHVNSILKEYEIRGRYNGSGNVYEKEELVQILAKGIEKNDGDMTYDEWNNMYSPPHGQTFIRRFGSWENALTEASE